MHPETDATDMTVNFSADTGSNYNVTKTPHVMGMLGEPMDGDNPKQMGQQSWTTSFIDQVQASSDLLKMWNAKNVIMVRGCLLYTSPSPRD